jgi:hypothetical protein
LQGVSLPAASHATSPGSVPKNLYLKARGGGVGTEHVGLVGVTGWEGGERGATQHVARPLVGLVGGGVGTEHMGLVGVAGSQHVGLAGVAGSGLNMWVSPGWLRCGEGACKESAIDLLYVAYFPHDLG